MTDKAVGADRAIVEYFELVDRGEVVDPERFIAEHEDVADQLRDFFEAASVVQQMAGPTVEQSKSSERGDAAESSATGSTAPNHAHDRPPQIVAPCEFGRYRVERELGQGAMGSVYLAHDTQLEREVALKIPGFDEAKEPEMIDRFYREARAAATLRSPHICPVYDVDQIEGVHFIAMAYIDGQPLSHWMAQDNARSPRHIAAIVHKLALALEKAHEGGVVHRDLKPSNIMIDAEGEPVVMDFGLARRIDQTDVRATKAGTLIGTPAYMSPEQIMGDSDAVGPTSDIYALGVILYELLTGQLPFQGSVISVIGQIVAGKPKPPAELKPGVDPRLAAVCQKMMAKRIEDRYQSMADVAKTLEDFLQDENERPFDRVAQAAEPPIRTQAAYVEKPTATAPAQVHRPLPETKSAAPWVLIIASILAIFLMGGCLVFGFGYFLLSRSQVAQEREIGAVEADQAAAEREQDAIRRQEQRLQSANEKKRRVAEDTAAAPSQTTSTAPGLKYAWQPEESYGYSLRIVAKRGNLSESLTGTLRYRVLEASKKETRLLFDSKLSSRVNSGFMGPPGMDRVSSFAPLSDVVRMFPRHEITVDHRGRVVENDCDARLPFALGSLAQLVVETLPEKRADEWETTRRTTIEIKRDVLPFSRGPFGRSQGIEKIEASATTKYTLKSHDSNVVVIHKQYDAATPAGSPYAITGEGETTFDRKKGVTTETHFSLKVTDNSGQAVNVTVDSRLLTEAELAERLEELEAETELSPGQQAKVDSLSQPPDPSPGKPVTSETPLAPGDSIQGHKNGSWRDVTVLELLDDGHVKVHWIGFGVEWDEAVPRSRLRILPGTKKENETD